MDEAYQPPADLSPAVRALLSTTHDRHLDMTRLVGGLPPGGLKWVPADGASTLAGLTLHVLDVERYLVALLTGEDIGWTGQRGTRITEEATETELIAEIEERDAEMKAAIAAVTAERWGSGDVANLLDDLDHVAVHQGQMQLTRNLYEAAYPDASGSYEHWR
jgi:hypothetical protein